MQVLGTVIAVAVDTDVKKKDGGTYKGWELVYKSDGGDVRTISKPIQGLTYNAPLKKALTELSAGDEFTLEQEKNSGGFYDVKKITKGWAQGEPSLPASPAKVSSAPTNSYQARDFETKEERTIRQRLIVRQSSLSAAVAVLTVGAKSVDKEAVKNLAEEFTKFVFEEGLQPRPELADDIPY
jgi:hypothetical protein